MHLGSSIEQTLNCQHSAYVAWFHFRGTTETSQMRLKLIVKLIVTNVAETKKPIYTWTSPVIKLPVTVNSISVPFLPSETR